MNWTREVAQEKEKVDDEKKEVDKVGKLFRIFASEMLLLWCSNCVIL